MTVKAEFRILGDDFHPDDITKRLGIQPLAQWEKGEVIKGKDRARSYSCWEIATGYEESWDVNDQLSKVARIVRDKKAELRALREQLDGLDYRFEVVVKIENGDVPAVHLESDMIELANEIEAVFAFDIYANPYPERPIMEEGPKRHVD
ncbi:MAG: DUF4279 domain-containing protein [Bacillota bacterium]